MNAPLTRRALLGATAAVGSMGIPIAAEAGLLAMVSAHPDATLLDLIARHREATALTEALDDACRAPMERFHALEPEPPVALDFRTQDLSYDLGGTSGLERRPDGRIRSFYCVADIDRLEVAPPVTMWGPYADDETPYRVPDPAGEARRQEILKAQHDWTEARIALSEAVGLRAANAAWDDALAAEVEIEDAIVAAVPATMEGFRAKAAWIVGTPSEDAGDRALSMLRALAERRAAS